MSEKPAAPRPPSPEELLASANRLLSRALVVSTARLIHESQFLRDERERAPGKAPKQRKTELKQPKSPLGE